MRVWPSGDDFVLRLDKGDDLMSSLIEFAVANNSPANVITSGLGGLDQLTLGEFQTDIGEFKLEPYEGFFEILNITGNVFEFDGAPKPHIHMIVRAENGKLLGGHVLSARVLIPIEMVIRRLHRDTVQRGFVEGCMADVIVERK